MGAAVFCFDEVGFPADAGRPLFLLAGLHIYENAAIRHMLIINIQGIIHIHLQAVCLLIYCKVIGLYPYYHFT